MLSRILEQRVCASTVACCLLAAGAATSFTQPAKPISRWRVVSSAPLDSRIERELKSLATEQDAKIRRAHNEHPKAAQPGELLLQLGINATPGALAKQWSSAAGDHVVIPTTAQEAEAYVLRARYGANGAPASIAIDAATARGLHLGLLRLPDLLTLPADKLATSLIPRPQSIQVASDGSEVQLIDFPAFPLRGVVEGFYGDPWTHADRLNILRFEGRHGMNLYIYGPKDDPYHRRLWREPYPGAELKRLSQLASAAHDNFVDFSFAVSPGLSITYSSDADFRALTSKLDSVRRLGVTNFALFLDDVPQQMVHAEDRARFHSLAAAHIALATRVYNWLKSLSADYRLTVCPTTYNNTWGSRDYIRELGAGLNPDIPIDWTGTDVIPPQITAEEATAWGALLHRKPLVWDNYPTDDGNNALPNIDPIRRRDPQLATAVAGLFSNPMNQAQLTQIPLETIADYLWNPGAYDSEASEQHALSSQYGPDAPTVLKPLLETFAAGGAPRARLRSLFEEGWEPVEAPAIDADIAQLRTLLHNLDAQQNYRALAQELRPIPDELAKQLAKLRADAEFKHRSDGSLLWDRDREAMKAPRTDTVPALDGDFAKWTAGPITTFDTNAQITDGHDLWKGPDSFSARVALRWDAQNLYIGLDVTQPTINQTAFERGIENGDALRLVLDTVPPQPSDHDRVPTLYDLYLSPGDFSSVKPSIYSDEDLFPVRPQSHDPAREIHTVWKKTPRGYSGDIVIPASFFGHARFSEGESVWLSFEVQRVLAEQSGNDGTPRIAFSSKGDSAFPVDQENPATLQRLDLLDK